LPAKRSAPKPARARRVTLKDVAAAVGVSHVAVSLALRDSPEIPPATKERILKAARELRYVPDESARRLKGGATGRIAYVASRLAHGFVGQVLVGMEQRSFESRQYFNAIHPYSTWFQTAVREDVLKRILYGGLADAVVLVSTKPDPATVREFKRHGLPLILVEDQAPGCHSVRVDNVLGAKLAVQRLAASGCKKIGLVAGIVGGQGLDLNPTALERREGFAQALKAAGLKADPKREQSVEYYERADGREALDRLLAADPGIDGIFCAAGDLVALGILERARALKRKVPQQLKLIGYDDIELASLVQPGLSTIRQPIQDLGAKAYDLAVAAVEGRLATEAQIVFKPALVLRETA
jgi:LacI family transcriptional regulator